MGSVPFVVRALENTVALTVVSCCFVLRVIHFWHTNNPQRTGHKGTITGCEKDENDTWKYKITFSDGEFTYACKGHPEVRFPNHHD